MRDAAKDSPANAGATRLAFVIAALLLIASVVLLAI
jgi:hypothetical protein